MVRRRGFVRLIDTDPRDLEDFGRHVPILLIDGRRSQNLSQRAARQRRDSMLTMLARSRVGSLIVLSGETDALPDGLAEIWAEEGFVPALGVVGSAASAALGTFLAKESRTRATYTLDLAPAGFAAAVVRRYLETRSDRLSVRVRGADGNTHAIDLSAVDDPARPLLSDYYLIAERDLTPVSPTDIGREEVEGFFKDVTASWRPYAAGIPWESDAKAWPNLRSVLRGLDRSDGRGTRNFYVLSESGAGATTFIRTLAFMAAREGYPTLVAGAAPFNPDARQLTNFLNNVLLTTRAAGLAGPEGVEPYEVPIVIIFDQSHWDGRDMELISFVRELESGGRRVVVITVPGPRLGLAMYGNPLFRPLGSLGHELSRSDVLELGRHLNTFLRHTGPIRSDNDWQNFYEASAPSAAVAVASFWIALSFWVQRQFDLGETIQSWLWRKFKTHVTDPCVRGAIVRIAALSTERQPLPAELLPVGGEWPVSARLSDSSKELAALGLVQFRSEGDRFWTLTHDLLGRFLLNALFWDHNARVEAGFGEAENQEHLRFLALAEIARQPALERKTLRAVAEAFAVSIFKIDPDAGLASFRSYWREALDALDAMPKGVRMGSRVFLHHTAISRRRIASDRDGFPMSPTDRVELLQRAVNDLELALKVTDAEEEERDINLHNSLGRALLDLAKVQREVGADPQLVAELKRRATENIRRAYAMDPDNSFVIEAHAQDLLANATADPDLAAFCAIDVLGIVYARMGQREAAGRINSLSRIADQAMDILMNQMPPDLASKEPANEAEAMTAALIALREGLSVTSGLRLEDYPKANRKSAADRLALSILENNTQALKLRYLLAAIDEPRDLALQLALVEQIILTAAISSAQQRLEYAVLLFQCGRYTESDREL